jgi:two-component system cell cycle response regulator
MRPRSHDRKATLLPARIISDGRSMECAVRDVSAGGARLRVAEPGAVPAEFQLIFQQTGEFRRAKVRWRRGQYVGVAFLEDRRVFGRRLTPPPAAE